VAYLGSPPDIDTTVTIMLGNAGSGGGGGGGLSGLDGAAGVAAELQAFD
jgi:hypothetical protein